jgi:hypothetical protein
MRVFSGNECIKEESILKLIEENAFCSDCKIASHSYPMEANHVGELEKCIVVAIAVWIDNSRTLVKVERLVFSGFRANRAIDDNEYTFRSDVNLEITDLCNLSEYANKSVIDIKLESSALWCLVNEDTNYKKQSGGFHRTSEGENTAFSFRTSVERYTLKLGLNENEYFYDEKWLRNQVWTLDDQLLLEKIEDNEGLHNAVVDNQVVKSRILRRYGGDYVRDIDVNLEKNPTHFKM